MNPMTANNTEQELKNLSEDWAAAELQGDTAFLERTLANDFIGIGPRGFMLTKEEWLQRITSGALTYDRFDWDEVTVRAYGDASIVVGRWVQKARYQGQPMDGEFRTTLVFMRQQGRWLLAGLQLSPISGPIPGMPPTPQTTAASSTSRR